MHLILVLDKADGDLDISVDHLADERVKVNPSSRARALLWQGFRAVDCTLHVSALETHLIFSHLLDFCGAEVEVFRVHFEDNLAGLDVNAHLVFAASFPSAVINEIKCLIAGTDRTLM